MGKFIDQINKLSDSQVETMLFCLADPQVNAAIETLGKMPGYQQASQIGELRKMVRKRKIKLPEEHKSFLKKF